MADTLALIGTATVTGSSTFSVIFNNISQGYTDLKIVMSQKTNRPDVYQGQIIYFNGTYAGSTTVLEANGGATVTSNSIVLTAVQNAQGNAASTTNIFGMIDLYIGGYTDQNKYKTAYAQSVAEANATTVYNTINFLEPVTPDSITSIKIESGNLSYALLAGSEYYLYGVFNQDVAAKPSTPTIGAATAGSQAASIAFTPVSGAASYTLTSSPGNITGTNITSPVVVSGLTSGTAYTFTVKANNPFGSSSSSSASSSVTPITAAGYVNYSYNYSVMHKFDMGTEVPYVTTIRTINEAGAMASNSGVSGYRFGTTTDPKTANQKFSFSSEAVSNLANALPQARQYATGQSNSGTAAYITGGATTGFAVRYKTIVKSPFSTDTPATLGTGFTDMGNANQAASNNHTAGYTFQGESDTTGAGNWINKINYSNDSISNSVATVPLAGRAGNALSNDGTAAYFGNTSAGTNALYKLLYSNDTRSTLSATLAGTALTFAPTSYRYQTAGYWVGGSDAAEINIIQKLTYSSEARTTIAATLPAPARNFAYGDTSNNGVI